MPNSTVVVLYSTSTLRANGMETLRDRLAKTEGGQFSLVTTSPVETLVSGFWNGRETVICMGQRNGTVVSKQALKYYEALWEPGKHGTGTGSKGSRRRYTNSILLRHSSQPLINTEWHPSTRISTFRISCCRV